ncbi:hypothetical protein COCCU_14200 (plasmid) [Corynebacterium occultum]|uniref:Uncharacterized protein n=1 Tax=Corynebacterium occultum TaxID=2675219 RepID=A0A6B8WFI3_9CORY|nr:hypothetical protein [Corynebacterium occultum]QGU08730.1 hypothetical protein COCCU_14200 [Corynebacterium occultum]
MLGKVEDALISTGYDELVNQARRGTAEGAEYERFMLLCDLVETHITTPGDKNDSSERWEAVQVITTCLRGLRRTADSAHPAAQVSQRSYA